MNAELELDVDRPRTVAAALAPSLRDGGTVAFGIAADDTVDITVEAEKLGSLRGGVNTALMLARLAEKTAAHER